MKYLITEQQNNKIIDMIKDFANTYAEERVVSTDVEVEYDPKRDILGKRYRQQIFKQIVDRFDLGKYLK